MRGKVVTPKYKQIEKSNGVTYAFLGEHNEYNQPDGFVRCINQHGNIYEGNFTKKVQINGFCAVFTGHSNNISLGWYKNDKRNGNWLMLKSDDLTIVESGWYQNNVRVGDMKEDS